MFTFLSIFTEKSEGEESETCEENEHDNEDKEKENEPCDDAGKEVNNKEDEENDIKVGANTDKIETNEVTVSDKIEEKNSEDSKIQEVVSEAVKKEVGIILCFVKNAKK